ncbi:MAG: zinc ribbon domain-containing protein, partial [Chloroflexota bacterium]|nr:zinc ribbon domain-containing protein [Chloroflexota bacterium]
WTFNDIRSRSKDLFFQLLAALLALVLGPIGLLIYLVLRPRETLAEAYARTLEEETLLQDVGEREVCPHCKRRVRPEFMFCPYCHTRLKKACPDCGRLLRLQWDICPYCGSALPVEASAEMEESETTELTQGGA